MATKTDTYYYRNISSAQLRSRIPRMDFAGSALSTFSTKSGGGDAFRKALRFPQTAEKVTSKHEAALEAWADHVKSMEDLHQDHIDQTIDRLSDWVDDNKETVRQLVGFGKVYDESMKLDLMKRKADEIENKKRLEEKRKTKMNRLLNDLIMAVTDDNQDRVFELKEEILDT